MGVGSLIGTVIGAGVTIHVLDKYVLGRIRKHERQRRKKKKR